MFQQQGIRWLEPRRSPRLGMGAFGIGIAAALVAGVVVVSSLVGSRAAPLAHGGTTVIAPPVQIIHPGLNVQDFGTMPFAAPKIVSSATVGTQLLVPQHLTRELLASDFASQARIGVSTAAGTPARVRTVPGSYPSLDQVGLYVGPVEVRTVPGSYPSLDQVGLYDAPAQIRTRFGRYPSLDRVGPYVAPAHQVGREIQDSDSKP